MRRYFIAPNPHPKYPSDTYEACALGSWHDAPHVTGDTYEAIRREMERAVPDAVMVGLAKWRAAMEREEG